MENLYLRIQMGSKLLKIIISFFVIIVLLVGIKKFISISNDVKNTVAKIQLNYKGVIVRKYKVRNTDNPTHLEVKIGNGKKLEIIPNEAVIEYAAEGDSIIKPLNENIVYIKKSSGVSRDFFYIKISYDTRSHPKFPDEWKNKWLRSSEWDLKN
jgi:hypothetical protein